MRIGSGFFGSMVDLAHRLWSGGQNAISRRMERLSTGLRINSAMDDAAGLAISEGLTARINGFDQGARNAQDGVSLIQTAEGGLGSMHDMLQRMRTLAVQAANGTYGTDDRAAIQREMNDLVIEIDSVVGRTEFNGMTLLDGSYAAHHVQVGPEAGDTVLVDIARYDCVGLGLRDAGAALVDPDGSSSTSAAQPVAAASVSFTATVVPSDATTPTSTATQEASSNSSTTGTLTSGPAVTGQKTHGKSNESNGHTKNPQTATVSSPMDALALSTPAPTATPVSVTGATASAPAGRSISVMDIESAQEAIGLIDDAIWTVSFGRSELGATQNRLEHTIRLGHHGRENLEAARMRIRDTDVALEMSSLVRRQITSQAAAAMMAQAQSGERRLMEALIP